MYKWHVHSAIGRGRPVANDFARVADGIAASLRQFSVSLSRTAEDAGRAPSSRSQRSTEAFKEVSSLAPTPSRGVDARSLAAKPPGGFTIRRVDDSFPAQGGSGRSRGSFVPRGSGDFRGGIRGAMRGGAGRGGAGRGGMRGRGRGGRGGRGRGDRGNKVRGPRQKQDDEEESHAPYTAAEREELVEIEGGYTAPYNPETSVESLARWGPAVVSSPRGLQESVIYKMQVATDNNPFYQSAEHVTKISKGKGTLFEDDEQRAITQAFKVERSKEFAKKMDVEFDPEKAEFGYLSKSDKEDMMKEWVAGQYVGPKAAEKGDILGQILTYSRRNETYLPDDSRRLEEKVRSLLPAQKTKPKPEAVKKPL